MPVYRVQADEQPLRCSRIGTSIGYQLQHSCFAIAQHAQRRNILPVLLAHVQILAQIKLTLLGTQDGSSFEAPFTRLANGSVLNRLRNIVALLTGAHGQHLHFRKLFPDIGGELYSTNVGQVHIYNRHNHVILLEHFNAIKRMLGTTLQLRKTQWLKHGPHAFYYDGLVGSVLVYSMAAN